MLFISKKFLKSKGTWSVPSVTVCRGGEMISIPVCGYVQESADVCVWLVTSSVSPHITIHHGWDTSEDCSGSLCVWCESCGMQYTARHTDRQVWNLVYYWCIVNSILKVSEERRVEHIDNSTLHKSADTFTEQISRGQWLYLPHVWTYILYRSQLWNPGRNAETVMWVVAQRRKCIYYL
jgi:hypothetical protein